MKFPFLPLSFRRVTKAGQILFLSGLFFLFFSALVFIAMLYMGNERVVGMFSSWSRFALFEYAWMATVTLGALLLFLGTIFWLKAVYKPEIKIRFFTRVAVFILFVLLFGGYIPIPLKCTSTHTPHGDGPYGAVYLPAVCLYSFPYESDYWTSQGDYTWVRINTFSQTYTNIVFEISQATRFYHEVYQ